MNAVPQHLPLSAAVLIWVNVLPYLSRMSRGSEWAAKYLPDDGFLVPGLILIHAMFSLPAIPLIWSLRKKEKPGVIWVLALGVVSIITWYTHKDWDLGADAQAATGLVIFPLISMVAAYGVLAVDRELRELLGKSVRTWAEKQSTGWNPGLSERIPGFRNLPKALQFIVVYILVGLFVSLYMYLMAA